MRLDMMMKEVRRVDSPHGGPPELSCGVSSGQVSDGAYAGSPDDDVVLQPRPRVHQGVQVGVVVASGGGGIVGGGSGGGVVAGAGGRGWP